MALTLYKPERTPSYHQFAKGLDEIRNKLTGLQRRLLEKQYTFPGHRCFASELADACGIEDWRVVNRQYAAAAKKFCSVVNFEPTLWESNKPQWWAVWSLGIGHGGGRFEWQMHDGLAEALEELGWVDADLRCGEISPEVVLRPRKYPEGAIRQVPVNAYERSHSARRECIRAHGSQCVVCDFNFGEYYGHLGEGFIHVHHLQPLSSLGETEVDPVNDMRPVCPNCHAMLHRTEPPLSIQDLKKCIFEMNPDVPSNLQENG